MRCGAGIVQHVIASFCRIPQHAATQRNEFAVNEPLLYSLAESVKMNDTTVNSHQLLVHVKYDLRNQLIITKNSKTVN